MQRALPAEDLGSLHDPQCPQAPWLENKTLRAIQGPLVHSRPSSWSVQWASCGLYNVQIDPSGLWMKSSMTYTIWYLGLMGFSCLSLKMPWSVWREHTCAPLFSSSIFFIKFLSDVTSCACISSHPNKFSEYQGTYCFIRNKLKWWIVQWEYNLTFERVRA